MDRVLIIGSASLAAAIVLLVYFHPWTYMGTGQEANKIPPTKIVGVISGNFTTDAVTGLVTRHYCAKFKDPRLGTYCDTTRAPHLYSASEKLPLNGNTYGNFVFDRVERTVTFHLCVFPGPCFVK